MQLNFSLVARLIDNFAAHHINYFNLKIIFEIGAGFQKTSKVLITFYVKFNVEQLFEFSSSK
jgi:hypothetical protein